MAIKINGRDIPKEHEAFFKETYSRIYSDWKKRKTDLEQEYEMMKPILIDFNIIPSAKFIFPDLDYKLIDNDILPGFKDNADVTAMTLMFKYDSNWGWLRKCQFIIDEKNSKLTSNELVAAIFEREPNLTIEKISNSIPATLSVAAKEGKIKRERVENGEYEYSLA